MLWDVCNGFCLPQLLLTLPAPLWVTHWPQSLCSCPCSGMGHPGTTVPLGAHTFGMEHLLLRVCLQLHVFSSMSGCVSSPSGCCCFLNTLEQRGHMLPWLAEGTSRVMRSLPSFTSKMARWCVHMQQRGHFPIWGVRWHTKQLRCLGACSPAVTTLTELSPFCSACSCLTYSSRFLSHLHPMLLLFLLGHPLFPARSVGSMENFQPFWHSFSRMNIKLDSWRFLWS